MVEKRLEKEELERLEKIVLSLDEHFDVREYGFGQAYEQCKDRPEELERDWEIFCAPDTDIVVKTKIGKEWAAKNKLDFDYDAADLANYIYWKAYFSDKELCYIVPEHGLEYRLIAGGVKYRGDTMNSWSSTLSRCTGPQKAYVQEFMKVVYTIGNFVPLPTEGGFNVKRNRVFKDYWDLTLRGIFKYYNGEKCHSVFQEEGVKSWLETFQGWGDFVKRNFMQPFVRTLTDGSFGGPLELWDNHFNGAVLPQSEGDFEQFFVNARIRILERGKLVVAALKKKMRGTETEN